MELADESRSAIMGKDACRTVVKWLGLVGWIGVGSLSRLGHVRIGTKC